MFIRTLILCLSIFSLTTHAKTSLPTSQDWLTHLTQGLAPYWMNENAFGSPPGNFPTFRCDDGNLLDIQAPCKELNMPWISPHFERDYTRMKSRQTYAYGVLFHLTGDKLALNLAKQGAYYLIDNLQDSTNGGYISYLENAKPGLSWGQRSSQDQAYALVGLAMYYYLTQDSRVEKALIEQQAFIFESYQTQDMPGLAWVLEDSNQESAKQQELVAQLDQINAYMLLVTPLLPEPVQSKWKNDLSWLTKNMLDHYHSQEQQRFYGAIHHRAVMKPNARHNDFGHTIKAYWMTFLSGKLLQQENWVELGLEGMQHTLQQAQYQQDFASISHLFGDELTQLWQGQSIRAWQSREYAYGTSSWEWAELDQAAMTLYMDNQVLIDALEYTLPSFMDAWVDHEYGGVGLSPKSTKAFHWGNGYHQFEHALVGYLFAQHYDDRAAQLYYARPATSTMLLNPYYFQADIASKTQIDEAISKVSFINIKP